MLKGDDILGMANNNLYSQKVLNIFGNAKNFGELKNPDAVGKVGNIRCGDEMWLYLKIGQKNGSDYIKDIKIKTFGCVAAIATSSIVVDLARGKNFKQALKIDPNKVMVKTGPLPKVKIHCSMLATDALVDAIYNYLSKNKKPISSELKTLLKNKLLLKKFGLK